MIFSIICWIIGFTLYNYTFKKINSLIFFGISAVLFVLHIYEQKRIIKCQKLGLTAHAQLKTEKIHDFMMKLISLNGKALGRAEWKKIKQYNTTLYQDLLSPKCNHYCYFYSLEIARIINDSNLRMSEKYEDFIKLYKVKLYRQWNSNAYSKRNFRHVERTKFRKWCKANSVHAYNGFF